jgi:hypothetical protein
MNQYSFVYEGQLSNDLNVVFGSLMKNAVQENMPETQRVQRLMSFALEMLDNALRYSPSRRVVFQWMAEGDKLKITVENDASMEDAERLKRTADHIRQLSPEEINEEYKRIMRNSEFNAKGGAGLGLLHMTKHGATSIDVNVVPAQENLAICSSTLTTSILRKEATV